MKFPEPYDYPDAINLLQPPEEFRFCYVSSSYLDGIVNYVKPERFFAEVAYYDCYDIRGSGSIQPSEEIIQQELTRLNNKFESQVHSSFNDCCDNRIDFNFYLFAFSPGYWWMFYYDQDVSDCELARIRNSTATLDEMIDHFIYSESRIFELDKQLLHGWLSR